MPTFTPPVVADEPWVTRRETDEVKYRLFRFFGPAQRGRSVIREAGHWTTVDVPVQSRIDAADLITDPQGHQVPGLFMGGHAYPVSVAVAAELTADGYAANLT